MDGLGHRAYEARYRRRIGGTIKQVVKDDGILGLWRGTFPTLIRYVLAPGIILAGTALQALKKGERWTGPVADDPV